MYKMVRIQSDITAWDEKEPGKTKSVRTVLVMDMLNTEERAEVEKAHEEFLAKVKTVVPDNPTPPNVRCVE